MRSDVVTRAAAVNDVPFMRAMIREAILASPVFVAKIGLANIERKEDEYWTTWANADGTTRDPAFVAVDAADAARALGAITLKPDAPAVDGVHGVVPRWRIGIGVVESARGRGVGRILIERALDVARERRADEVSLHVDPNNTRAIALYRRLGFATTAEREHAIEMRARVRAA